MKKISKAEFFDITKLFEYVPYTQSSGWFSFFYGDKKEGFIFLVDDDNNPQVACFGHVKKSFGLKMLVLEGECLKSNSYKSSLIKSFYEVIPSMWHRPSHYD